MKKSDYRVKCLATGSNESQGLDEISGKNLSPVKLDSGAVTAQLHQALGSPRMIDILYHYDGLAKIAALWPTFSYLQSARRYGPIKSAPVHLADHLGPVLPPDEDELAEEVKNLTYRQGKDEIALDHVLAAHRDDREPPFEKSSLAMSVASALFRSSTWLKKNREKLLAVILESPEAAYVALASGAWTKDASVLVDKITASPSLVLQLLKSPVLRRHITEAGALDALSAHPVYRAAALSLHAANRDAICRELHQRVRENILAASVSLGIDPNHPDADAWWKLIRVDGRALYWLGRTWHAGGHLMAELPRYDDITGRMIFHPRWLYHWCRDLEPHGGATFARQLWPSPWAVELIVDLQLPTDLVVDLVKDSDLNENDLWESSLLFWAAVYVNVKV